MVKSSLFFLASICALLVHVSCATAPSGSASAEAARPESAQMQSARTGVPSPQALLAMARRDAGMQPQAQAEDEPLGEPQDLAVLRRAYPDVSFDVAYDEALSDWKISVSVPDGSYARKGVFYWCGGRLLPREELGNRDSYWQLMYRYNNETPDPANFTQEDIDRIRQFSSPENRQNGASSPQFFYDLLYDCTTRVRVEQHIVKITFLGKGSNVHRRIVEPLKRVEAEILEAAKTSGEVSEFVQTLASADSYNWREIRDSGNRSFHSIGIAIDVLPRGWNSKNIYWSWRRDVDPDNWMLLPLERRWMPPQAVRDIFERNGFIWGGNWIIWDNMHFEYRPEVILYAQAAADEKAD